MENSSVNSNEPLNGAAVATNGVHMMWSPWMIHPNAFNSTNNLVYPMAPPPFYRTAPMDVFPTHPGVAYTNWQAQPAQVMPVAAVAPAPSPDAAAKLPAASPDGGIEPVKMSPPDQYRFLAPMQGLAPINYDAAYANAYRAPAVFPGNAMAQGAFPSTSNAPIHYNQMTHLGPVEQRPQQPQQQPPDQSQNGHSPDSSGRPRNRNVRNRAARDNFHQAAVFPFAPPRRNGNRMYPVGAGTNNIRVRTEDQYRCVYTEHQRLELEKEYSMSQFICGARKTILSEEIELTERQIKIWFQNRRAKMRRETRNRQDVALRNGGH